MLSSLDLSLPSAESMDAEQGSTKEMKALTRWHNKHGLEVEDGALSRLLGPEEPEPKSKEKNTFVLRADAPVFTPGCLVAKQDEKGDQEEEEDGSPAVISVKKSHRGCAVVLLRSRKVLERAVRQSVAVVDGVCVEVKRHSKSSETGEQQLGVFVAWGNRVERKAPVSPEGLEAYFNALAMTPCPSGLEACPPFPEQMTRFSLTSSLAAGVASSSSLALDFYPKAVTAGKDNLRESPFCKRELVENLWEQKHRLDDLWNIPPPPLARSLMTRVARAQLFPHSGEGGKEHENRAGDKLAELAEGVGLFDGVPHGTAFLDLCGGPGAWSQFLLAHESAVYHGFGFTLRTGAGEAEDWQAEDKDQWYPELTARSDWRALWGADGTGDLLKPGNIEHVARTLKSQGGVFLCLADGGFSDDAIPPNLLELYFYRLFLAELLTAINVLQPGGRFVCKLYSTLSSATESLLYLVTRMFDSVEIVKPKSSRVTGPERYLSAFGFQEGHETAAIRKALSQSHKVGGGASPLTMPLLTPIIPADQLARDTVFMDGARAMSTFLCERQAKALGAVVDRAGFLEDMAMSVSDLVPAAAVPAPSPAARVAEVPRPLFNRKPQEQSNSIRKVRRGGA